MMETIYLITGIILLGWMIFDFFFTTLSGSGSSFFGNFISKHTHKAVQALARHSRRKSFRFSGMIINLALLLGWLLLIWLGLFLVFSSNPAGIVNDHRQVASTVERLYFTGYALSTLGMGDVRPITPSFKILTSAFSFFGFIFFTTSMTYLISISSAVITKRSLAMTIRNLGSCPREISKTLTTLDQTYCLQLIFSLQQMIDKHSVGHQAYPVVHYYNNDDVDSSLSINLASLDEALTVLLFNGTGKMDDELGILRKSLTQFYLHIEKKYAHVLVKAGDAKSDHFEFSGHGLSNKKIDDDPDVRFRRNVLGGLLQTENFTWQDVYNCSGK
jgi:hypothetical protein